MLYALVIIKHGEDSFHGNFMSITLVLEKSKLLMVYPGLLGAWFTAALKLMQWALATMCFSFHWQSVVTVKNKTKQKQQNKTCLRIAGLIPKWKLRVYDSKHFGDNK